MGLIVALGIYLWPTWSIAASSNMPTAPGWGTVRDALLDGPDAGEWARSIVALSEGRFSDVDVHRAPTWMLLVNMVMSLEEDVVLAGHLTNHLLLIIAGLTVWLIGRLSTGRSLGLAAAALTMVSSHGAESASRFGVDMAVMAMVPLTILAAQLACRKGPFGLVAGGVAGVVMATHLSTLPYALPALLLIILAGHPGRRRIAVPLYILGLVLVLAAWRHFLVIGTFEDLQVSLANGIAPGYQGDGMVSSWAAAFAVIQAGTANAMSDAIGQLMGQIRPLWLPMGAAVVLFWAGVLGPGLRKLNTDANGVRGTQVWRTLDWKLGLTLLTCLAPLPLLAAAQAPERYGANLAPFGAILLVRGGFSAGAMALWALGKLRDTGDGFRGPVFAAIGMCVFGGEFHQSTLFTEPLRPTQLEVGRWMLGQSLKEHFPPNTGIAIVVREPIVAGHHERCPSHVCPEDFTEAAFAQCLHMMNMDCSGDGPLAYVGVESDLQDPNAPARGAMDQWVAKRWSPIDQIDVPGFTASVFAIPRSEIPETELPEYLSGPPKMTGASAEVSPFVAEPTLDRAPKDRSHRGRTPSLNVPLDSSSLERPAPNKPPSNQGPMPDIWGEAPKGVRSNPPLGPDRIPLPGARPPPLGPDGVPLPAEDVEP